LQIIRCKTEFSISANKCDLATLSNCGKLLKLDLPNVTRKRKKLESKIDVKERSKEKKNKMNQYKNTTRKRNLEKNPVFVFPTFFSDINVIWEKDWFFFCVPYFFSDIIGPQGYVAGVMT